MFNYFLVGGGGGVFGTVGTSFLSHLSGCCEPFAASKKSCFIFGFFCEICSIYIISTPLVYLFLLFF